MMELFWQIVFHGPVTWLAALLRWLGADLMRLRRPGADDSLWVAHDRPFDMQSQW